MVEIYKWIYEKLSQNGDIYKDNLERNEEGKAVIDDVKIVYKTPNIFQSNVNKNRTNVPLQIDIWGRVDQDLEIENIIKNVDEEIRGEVYRGGIPFFDVERDITWRNNIPDEDKNIMRSQLNYVIRMYE